MNLGLIITIEVVTRAQMELSAHLIMLCEVPGNTIIVQVVGRILGNAIMVWVVCGVPGKEFWYRMVGSYGEQQCPALHSSCHHLLQFTFSQYLLHHTHCRTHLL